MPSSQPHLFRTTTAPSEFNLFNLISTSLITLCFLLPSTVAASTNASETDRLALLSFKSLIWSDPSGALSSWSSSINHCKWQGVSCGRQHPDRVTGLSLDSFLLAGPISPSLGNLTFLQNLSLSNNQLSGTIPEELGRMNRLRYLRLGWNSLHGSISSVLGNNCSNLEILSLRDNSFTGTIPSSFEQCQNLWFLGLRNNFLTGGIPPSLGNLRKLKYLELLHNNITGTIPPVGGEAWNHSPRRDWERRPD